MEWQLPKEEVKMKLLVSLNRKEVDDYLDYTNSFIIGLKDYSINYLEFTLEEIKDLLNKYPEIELFISINKNIFNHEINDLEKKLSELNKLPIKGLLFYDLAVLSIVNRLSLKIPLCWHQTHMVTNYNTCNYYKNKGCTYAYLSSEITASEMEEIANNCNLSLMALFMGHPIVSHSKRMLLSNYFTNFSYKKEDKNYLIKSNDSANYYIKETNNGTSIIYGNIVNGAKYLINLKDYLDYAILDEQYIEHDKFIDILNLFNKIISDNVEVTDKLLLEIENIIGNDTGFFDKKTIYKVKKHEKN